MRVCACVRALGHQSIPPTVLPHYAVQLSGSRSSLHRGEVHHPWRCVSQNIHNTHVPPAITGAHTLCTHNRSNKHTLYPIQLPFAVAILLEAVRVFLLCLTRSLAPSLFLSLQLVCEPCSRSSMLRTETLGLLTPFKA